jgi:hypothetical protein
MQLPLTGGCECKNIRYEIRASPLTLYACHCTECQRQTGAAFGLSMVVPRDALAVVRGTPKQWRRVVEGRGRVIWCFFCGDCGGRLFHNPEVNPKVSIVKPGTLDDTRWLEPVAHIWTDSAQPWVSIPQHAANCTAQPTDHTAMIEAWSARQPALR